MGLSQKNPSRPAVNSTDKSSSVFEVQGICKIEKESTPVFLVQITSFYGLFRHHINISRLKTLASLSHNEFEILWHLVSFSVTFPALLSKITPRYSKRILLNVVLQLSRILANLFLALNLKTMTIDPSYENWQKNNTFKNELNFHLKKPAAKNATLLGQCRSSFLAHSDPVRSWYDQMRKEWRIAQWNNFPKWNFYWIKLRRHERRKTMANYVWSATLKNESWPRKFGAK